MYTLASMSLTASAAGSGLLVLVALVLFAVATVIAFFVTPRALWAGFTSAGLAVFMLALLIGP